MKMSCEDQIVTTFFIQVLASLVTSAGVVLAFKNTIKSSPDIELRRAYILTCIIGGILGVISNWLIAAGVLFGVIGIVILLFFVSYRLSVRIYAFNKMRLDS